MSIPVVIQGITYDIPTQGESPPWGDELTSLLQALVNEINSSIGPSDILTTGFAAANNQSSSAIVTGLSFDPAKVRSAIISYSIYQSSSTNEFSECGQIFITYKSIAHTWELSQVYVGSSAITFSITSAGQIQYTSTDIGSTSYVGKIKFSAITFLQT